MNSLAYSSVSKMRGEFGRYVMVRNSDLENGSRPVVRSLRERARAG